MTVQRQDVHTSSSGSPSRQGKQTPSSKLMTSTRGGGSKASYMKRSAAAGHSSSASLSSRGKTGSRVMAAVEKAGRPAVAVFDEAGVDVTPQPLLATASSRHARPGGTASSKAVGSRVSTSSEATASGTLKTPQESAADFISNFEYSAMQLSGFKQSAVSHSGSKFSESSYADNDDDAASIHSTDSVDDDIDVHHRNISHDGLLAAGVKMPVQLSDAEMNRLISITLQETDTVWLFSFPTVTVGMDPSEEALVKAANARFAERKEHSNADCKVDRAMQTFNYVMKNKDVQATAARQVNAECQTSTWLIHDAYESIEAINAEAEAALAKDNEKDIVTTGPGAAPLAQSHSTMGASASIAGSSAALLASGLVHGTTRSMVIGGSESIIMNEDGSVSEVARSSSVMASEMSGIPGVGIPPPSTQENQVGANSTSTVSTVSEFHKLNQARLRETLLVVERAVVQNNYLKKLALYRESEPVNSTEKKESFTSNIPSLQLLWAYKCDLTRGRIVNQICYNKQIEDIIAVSYGETQAIGGLFGGLILCWSVKNPEYPERVYRSKFPVTSLDFSTASPNLLAAGYADGHISVFDVRSKSELPTMDNTDVTGKHRDPVWQVKWVPHEGTIGEEQSQSERLVSISSDGRVIQWLLKKGMEPTELMTLKLLAKQSESGKRNENSSSFVSRTSGGLCFDFNVKDLNIYLAGTEEGLIHRCSASYNEQYLDSYSGHTGPVYRAIWNPFVPQVFLSCSADWTMRLWHQDNEHSIFKFQSGRDPITDVAWSANCSTLFGCVSEDGRIEVWDLAFSTLDPAVIHSVLDRKLTSMLFGKNSPTVLTGDDHGTVTLYKLRNLSSIASGRSLSAELQSKTLMEIVGEKNNTGPSEETKRE